MAPRWSRSSTEGGCREDGAEEGRDEDRSLEGEDRSPPSQAPARSGAASGVEEEGGLMAKTEEVWTQLATRIPKSLHRELKLHCVHADTSVMDFVVAALKEKLATQGRRGRRAR
jgi:hypothetical protein